MDAKRYVSDDGMTVTYEFLDEPSDYTRRRLDPDSPIALKNEEFLRLVVEHDPDPEMRERARRGLKRLEELRRNGNPQDAETDGDAPQNS